MTISRDLCPKKSCTAQSQGSGFDPVSFLSSSSFRHFSASSGFASRRAGIAIDQAVDGFGVAGLGGGWDVRFALLHPGIAFDEERPGAPGFFCTASSPPSMLFVVKSPGAPGSGNCFSRIIRHSRG